MYSYIIVGYYFNTHWIQIYKLSSIKLRRRINKERIFMQMTQKLEDLDRFLYSFDASLSFSMGVVEKKAKNNKMNISMKYVYIIKRYF